MLRRFLCLAAFSLALLQVAHTSRADKVTLKDGSVIYGTVIPQGKDYWIKTEAGEKQIVPKESVKSIQKGVRSSGGGKPGNATKTPGATGRRKPVPTLATATSRARVVTKPIAAVAIWQEFLDTKPKGDELKQARAEMAKWQKLADSDAERIKGKWVGGPELKAILAKAENLSNEGIELMQNDQTLAAIKKFQESVEIYPNSFRGQFSLGRLMMLQDKTADAQKYFDAALKLNPNCPEVLANLGLLQYRKKQYVKAIQLLHKAAQGRDSEPIVINLCSAIMAAPPRIRSGNAVKPALEAANLLSRKYNIQPGQFVIVPMHEDDLSVGEGDAIAGAMSSGTGFIIGTDGLVLTNRHVVDKGKTFMVMLNDDTKVSAEVVVMDEDQDLALIRLKNDEGEDGVKKEFPTVRFCEADAPADGADCIVMGFPMIDRLGANIKITRGIISSGAARAAGPDVVIDARVNPGNSGGPILDKDGNVMAIVSMKSLSNAMEDSYGLGISAGNIRKFLEKNNVEMEVGDPSPTPLSAEQIAAKVKPATVCILATY